ncbi:hypothetical protein D021_0347, partial [Vibrio parahaemolyticus 10296]
KNDSLHSAVLPLKK